MVNGVLPEATDRGRIRPETPLIPSWKTIFLKAAGFGAGVVLALALVIGSFVWYSSRPKPPKPWNTRAIVAIGTPGFGVNSDGKGVGFSYEIENSTGTDYKIESKDQITVMGRKDGGNLSQALPTEIAPLTVPIFIPTKQRGTVTLSLVLSDIPKQRPSESNEEFHEQLRAYCQQMMQGWNGFVLFDESNRYQIERPKLLAQAPPKKTP